MQSWIVAIGTILVLQTMAANLSRVIPVASPAFMAEFGWEQSWIGYLSTATVVGALFVLFVCVSLIRRIGSVLALQITLLIGAASLVLLQFPSIAVALVASALIGFSTGAANPAGADVLQRYTPAARRNLVFSIKQAGVPLGGVVAGLSIPFLIDTFGWRTALMIAAGGTIAVTLLVLPFRSRIEVQREGSGQFRLAQLATPLRAVTSTPTLTRVSLVGVIFSINQSCWFTFTVAYLVAGLGLSLGVAGVVFATMQAFGVVGRILLGWIADHTSSTATLASVAVVSSAVTTLFAVFQPDWPVGALVVISTVAGSTVAAWNGVQIAEVARRSPHDLVGESVAGNTILVYFSNMLAPTAFAAFVAATGRFDVAFMITGLCSLACVPLVWSLDRDS